MNLRDLEKGTEETGVEVAELLAGLPRVEAPANFNFGVNARIAAGRPSGRSLVPFLKAAIPLSLLLLVGGYVIFYGTLPAGNDVAVSSDSAVISRAPETKSTEPTAPADSVTVSNPRVATPSEAGVKVVPASAQSSRRVVSGQRRVNPPALTTDGGAGSRDTALSPANVIQAPGTNTNKNPEVPVRDLLEMLGMKVDNVGGKWTVVSTNASSIAERSGVLVSDIVESINDQAISGKDKVKGTVFGKALTILRGGKSIKLDLKR